MKLIAKLLTIAFCASVFATITAQSPANAAGKMGMKGKMAAAHHRKHHKKHHKMGGKKMGMMGGKKMGMMGGKKGMGGMKMGGSKKSM